MSVEHAKHTVGFVASFHTQFADPAVLHVLAPALHLSAGVAHTGIFFRLGLLLRLGLRKIDTHQNPL